MSKLAPILVIVLAVACLAEGVVLMGMEARLSRIEGSIPEAPRDGRTSASRGPSATAELQRQETVRELVRRVDVLEQERPGTSATTSPGEEEVRPDGPLASASARATLDERVGEIVDRKLAERQEGRDGKEDRGVFGDENKPSIGELAKAVSMTEEQENASVRTIDDGKRQAFELLSIRREDGTTMVDELMSAIRDSEDPQKEMQKWVQRLMTEKVPGRPVTYLAEILKIQKSTWDGLGRALDEGQLTKLRRMGVDILEVKTGYDPYAELLADE